MSSNQQSLRYMHISKFYNNYRKWLENPFVNSFVNVANETGISKWPILLSSSLENSTSISRVPTQHVPIALIQQFYIPTDALRLAEVRQTLALNAANTIIDKIILLNERIYTPDELGVNYDKIIQVVISHRLTFKDAFDYAYNHLAGHVVALSNADIFLDASIGGFASKAAEDIPIVLTQLRYEFNPLQPLSEAQIELPLANCQDTWIWCTDKFYISPLQRKAFDFPLGKPGCDNRVAHLFAYSGAKVINHPQAVKTYHNHSSRVRNWHTQQPVEPPYLELAPFGIDNTQINNSWAFDPYECQRKLLDFLMHHLTQPVLIPRCGGKAMQAAVFAISGRIDDCREILQKHFKFTPGDEAELHNTVHALLGSIRTSNQRFWSGPSSDETAADRITYAFSNVNFKQPAFDADLCSAVTMAFHKERWTDLLAGKKVSLVTSHKTAVETASSARVDIVGFDAFPNCELSIIDMPNCRGNLQLAVDEACKSDIVILDEGVLANEIAAIAFSVGKWALSIGPQALTLFGVMPRECTTLHSTSMALRPGNAWVVV